MNPTLPVPSPPTPTDDLAPFLRSIYPPAFFALSPSPSPSRPFVTLTYAQSLDGKIAGPGGAQIRLSGDESMRLTHRLREIHDSIMVGIGTVLSDDPQLNARLPSLLPLSSQPQPIILDTKLRTPVTAKLIKNYHALVTPKPIVLCDKNADSERRKGLERAGATVEEIELDDLGRISLAAVLDREFVGRSLMVEGGTSVISALLSSRLVDLVVITIAPVLIGDGISMIQGVTDLPKLEHVASKTFGRDVVVVCRPALKPT